MTNSSGGYGSNKIASGFRNPVLIRMLGILYPPMPTLNIIPTHVLNLIRDTIFKPNAVVLNIGSGGKTGCGRRLWKNIDFNKFVLVNMDLGFGDSVNLLGNAQALPIKNNSIDVIIMQAVIEHLPDPSLAFSEVDRVLRPGGKLYIEMPFLQGYHADPHDYQRYTLRGLQTQLAGYTKLYAGVSVGPFCTLVWLLRDGFSSCFRNRYLYLLSRFVLGWILSPVRYLDLLSRYNQAACRLANEYYYLCQKKQR